jgi:uncharacterized protein YjiS (DUF1127 family)
MAMTQMTAFTDRKSIGTRAPTAQVLGLLGRLFARWQSRRQLRRDQTWLQRQPDYMLRDIGIGRGEIETITRGGRFR